MRLLPNRWLAAGSLAALATIASSGLIPSHQPSVEAADQPAFSYAGRYTTGLANLAAEVSSGEVVAYEDGRMFVTNATDARLDLVDLDGSGAPTLVKTVDMKPFFATDHDGDPATTTELTSVAVKNGIVAAALKADDKVSPGKVVFLTRDGSFLADVTVGSLPDMVTFSTAGLRLLVANEGEPDNYLPGNTDPEGTVTIVSVVPYLATYRLGWSTAGAVKTVSFEAFNVGGPRHGELPAGVRIFGPGASVAQDLEPEYISVGPDPLTAYVTLQENNAVAVVNVITGRVERLLALGFKDHNVPGSGLDASDRDGPGNAALPGNIQNWPVKGMYMPDAIDSYRVGRNVYFVTANEGDARDYAGLDEETRAGDLVGSPQIAPFISGSNANDRLSRLNVTSTLGDGGDGVYEELYAFGARSFSIWDASTGARVFDSGDRFEQTVKAAVPSIPFNVSNNSVAADDRSDNKGPEPEAIVLGKLRGRTYAFIGLERQGGVMVYDVTSPADATFVTYINSRDYTQPAAPDSGPEVLVFVEAKDSPTGTALLLISNEVSGTVAVVQIG